MPEIPTHPEDIASLIFQKWEDKADTTPREHLGASLIGKPCLRELWYSFRWVQRVYFEGRMLRLFDVGHRFEDRISEELREIGINIVQNDDRPDSPTFGTQYRIGMWGGHFGGSMDGVCNQVPQGGKAWHIAEFKTWKDDTSLEKILKKLKTAAGKIPIKELRSVATECIKKLIEVFTPYLEDCNINYGFSKLVKYGVKKTKYQHYCQMQIYMGFTGLKRALYVAENKNDSDLYFERVYFDEDLFSALIRKAETIIFGLGIPGKISDKPESMECKYCDFKNICHYNKAPLKTCRTCVYSRPGRDGNWYCDIAVDDSGAVKLSKSEQLAGCEHHEMIEGIKPKGVN